MNNFRLDNEPKLKSGFIVPEHYFDDFSKKVMTKLPQEKPKVISIWAKNKKWLYASAAVITLSISIPMMNNFQNDASEVNAVAIENYLTSNSSISSADFADLLDMEDIKNIDVNSNLSNDAIEDELSTSKNLEQYITN